MVATASDGKLGSKNQAEGSKAKRMSLTNRRSVLAGLGTTAVVPATFRAAIAGGSQAGFQAATLVAKAETITLRPGRSGTPAWTLQAAMAVSRFKRGELQITLQNELPTAIALCVRGIDGAPL